jgi:hypothetical protein
MKLFNWLLLCVSISFGLNMVQFYQQYSSSKQVGKTNIVEIQKQEIPDFEKSLDLMQFSNKDLDQARQSGKVDGKIDAILMMQSSPVKLTEDQIDNIIEIGNKYSGDIDKNYSFLSLLSQAAFHKGLHSGLEEADKLANEEYEKGYHKALEDAGCPAPMSTPHNIKVPPKLIK